MSQWIERVRSHAVWQHLQSLGTVVDQAVRREEIDAQTVDGLERTRTVLTFAGKRLASADPALVSPAILDSITTALQGAIGEIQAFVSDGNAGHIANANAHADSMLGTLAPLPGPLSLDELSAINEAAGSYRTSLEIHLQSVQTASATVGSDLEALRSRLSEISMEVTTERQRLSSLASEFQAQFSTAQDSRSREFSEATTARQERFAKLVEDYSQKLTDQTTQSNDALKAAQDQFDDQLGDLKKQFAERSASVLQEVNEHKAQVEKLVGVIGNLGVTSGYLTTANHARRQLWVWQGVTVLALGGLIFVAWKAFLPTMEGGFSWQGFAGRALLSLTVGVLAAYAASQADKFLEIERRNRKLALELEAIGPYLAPLPQEKQEEFRLGVGDRTFGRDDSSLGGKGGRSPATVMDVLRDKGFRELISEIVKAAK